MSIDRLIESWKDTRNGLIDEAAQIPAEQFSFRATQEIEPSPNCCSTWWKPKDFRG